MIVILYLEGSMVLKSWSMIFRWCNTFVGMIIDCLHWMDLDLWFVSILFQIILLPVYSSPSSVWRHKPIYIDRDLCQSKNFTRDSISGMTTCLFSGDSTNIFPNACMGIFLKYKSHGRGKHAEWAWYRRSFDPVPYPGAFAFERSTFISVFLFYALQINA